MATDGRLRVGMVGCGYISAMHGHAWLASLDVELVAVCDQDQTRARARAQQWGVANVYSDAAEMIARERLDILDIVTRPETHTKLVQLGADNGIAVICQKPLAGTIEEATAMVDYCDARGVRFMVNEMWRYVPSIAEMAKQIQSGAVGTPHYLRTIAGRQAHRPVYSVYVDQPYFRNMPKLIIYEAMIHWIDSARFLMGNFDSVYARAQKVDPRNQGEDHAIVTYGHVGGSTSLHEASWVTPGGPPDGVGLGDSLVEGSEGVLHFSRSGGELRLTTVNETRVLSRHPSWQESYQAGFDRCMGHFASAIRTGAPFNSPGRDNLETLKGIFAAYKSIETGQAVRL